MAADLSFPVRRAILPVLAADPGVLSLVPGLSIFPSTVPAKPAFPFIRYGAALPTPFRASGLDSTALTVAIHGFTKPLYDGGGAKISSAEDQAYFLAAAIVSALGDTTLAVPGGKARVTWTGSTSLPDGDEPDAWHCVVNFRVEVAG